MQVLYSTDYPDLFVLLGTTTPPDFPERLPIGVGSNNALDDVDALGQANRALDREHTADTNHANCTTATGSQTRLTAIQSSGRSRATDLPHYALRFMIRAT